jgi:hypothetical protein
MEKPSVQTSEKQILKLVKGNQSIIPDVRQQEGSTILYVSDQLQQTGLYNLQKQDSTLAIMAFNDNRSESDLSYFSRDDLKKSLPDGGNILMGNKGSLKDAVSQTNLGMQLWKLCIILALIFLAAEILLIRFFKLDKTVVAQPV